MPRSKAQNEAIRAERRQAILAAAIDQFADHGFSAANMSEVAKAAGVSHGTVFLYFPTKESLFAAAVKEPLDEHLASILTALRGEGTPVQRIRCMVQGQVAAFARQTSYLRLVQYVLVNKGRFAEVAESLFRFSAAQTAELVAVIKAGQAAGELAEGNPELIAWAYFSWLNGIALVFDAPPDYPIWVTAPEYGMRIFSPVGTKG